MNAATATDTLQDSSEWSRGVLAKNDSVTPSREIRATDVQRLSFPLQMVIAAVIGAVTIYGTVQGATWGLRSDVRDILTRMQAQAELAAEKSRLQDERFNSLRDTVQDMKRRVELQQYEVQRLNETIAAMNKRGER